MKIKATVDKYCYTSKPTDSDAKKMRMRLPQEENYYRNACIDPGGCKL